LLPLPIRPAEVFSLHTNHMLRKAEASLRTPKVRLLENTIMHHIQEFCSRGSATGRTFLAGCDVRARLIVAVTAIVAIVMSTSIGFGLIALACSVAGLAAVRTPPKALIRRLMGPLAIAALVLLMQTFMTGATPMATIDLGFCRLTASWEGFWSGALIASRVLGSFGIVVLMCHGTPVAEILGALRWARVPRTWIEIAMLMYRYLHVFFEQATSIALAQRIRLGYSNLRRSFQSLGSLAGMVVLRSLDQAEKSHEAMTARGYRGHLPLPAMPRLPWRQVAFACSGVTVIVAAYVLAERWPL